MSRGRDQDVSERPTQTILRIFILKTAILNTDTEHGVPVAAIATTGQQGHFGQNDRT